MRSGSEQQTILKISAKILKISVRKKLLINQQFLLLPVLSEYVSCKGLLTQCFQKMSFVTTEWCPLSNFSFSHNDVYSIKFNFNLQGLLSDVFWRLKCHSHAIYMYTVTKISCSSCITNTGSILVVNSSIRPEFPIYQGKKYKINFRMQNTKQQQGIM